MSRSVEDPGDDAMVFCARSCVRAIERGDTSWSRRNSGRLHGLFSGHPTTPACDEPEGKPHRAMTMRTGFIRRQRMALIRWRGAPATAIRACELLWQTRYQVMRPDDAPSTRKETHE